MFCSICNFVHRYEMAGRVSEESNELFNGVLMLVKRLLASMPVTVVRVELINARIQGNLNGDISEPELVILKKTTGTKRGTYR